MDDTRQQLLDAAADLLTTEGTEALTLRATARRAGVSHNTPYRHFANVDDLLSAVAERGFRQLHAQCLAAQQGAGSDPLLRFHSLGTTYLLFAWDQPGYFRVMFDARCQRNDGVRSAESAVLALVVSAIASAQRQGKAREGDAQELALIAWSGVHGYALLKLNGLLSWLGFDGEPEAIAARYARQVFLGLRPL